VNEPNPEHHRSTEPESDDPLEGILKLALLHGGSLEAPHDVVRSRVDDFLDEAKLLPRLFSDLGEDAEE
jgi:hypothetical protein